MLKDVCPPSPGDSIADAEDSVSPEQIVPAEGDGQIDLRNSQEDANFWTRCTSEEIEMRAQEFKARHSKEVAQVQARQRDSLVTDILFGSGRRTSESSKSGHVRKGHHGKKKGAFGGVFVPTCENMWGVLIFLRFYTIVGQAGVAQALCVVVLSFSAAFCTVSSMSAIASSGGMQGQGGPYYMISRALGPCVGASVGIMYWLAITMLAVLECLGAVEGILMAAPSAWFSGCVQVYGSCLMMTLVFSVYLGINFVHKLGIFFVFVVFFTLFSYYYGLITAPSTSEAQSNWMITGPSLDTFANNWHSHYSPDFHFGTALSIFFPCFTGILSGANRADILKDPPKNIRQGTFGAIIFSLFMYSSFMILWGSVADYRYLQGTQHLDNPDDGRRLAGGGEGAYIVEEIVWNPFPHAAHLGIIISSLSQALQCLIVAPRLLQSIAKDRIFGALNPLAPLSRKGEPARALGASYIVAGLLVLIGSLDLVAPLLSMCFLVCYTFMNLSCFCLTWLRSPQWRPEGIQKRRWRLWYLGTGFCGFIVCLTIMFTVDPVWAAGALGLASTLYVYMNWQIEEKEWGSSFDGIRFQLALDALTTLEKSQHQAVNWRPQVLILYKVNVSDELKGIQHHEILRFYSMLLGQKRNGFCVVACVLDGDRKDHSTLHKAQSEKTIISTIMQQEGIKGFAEVVVAPNWGEGSNYVIQLTGIGGLVPNTVLLDWPTRPDTAGDFVETVGTAVAERKAVLAVKGTALMPTKEVIGTIDVWWMIHDGGFMVLLGWLLVQHRVWRDCKVRVFTVTVGIDSDQAKQAAAALTALLKKQRLVDIAVEVMVVDGGMKPFTHDGALRASERREFLGRAQPSVARISGSSMERSIPMEVDDLLAEQAGVEFHDNSFEDSAHSLTKVDGAEPVVDLPDDHACDGDEVEKLRQTIVTRSRRAQLVVMNLPGLVGSKSEDAHQFVSYCNAITTGLDRVLFVHSSGHEIFDLHGG